FDAFKSGIPKRGRKQRKKLMAAYQNSDRRRYGVIEVRQINDRTYHLTINGTLWSEVEWSGQRRAWCIQDACGHCLAHCEHTHATHLDQRQAIALAKAMIRDGRMPTPEEARWNREERQRQQQEQPRRILMPDLDSRERVPVPVVRTEDN